jgi:hypothetical protein
LTDERENDIRRWWVLLSTRYPPYAADHGWILCTDWPRWRDIGYLLVLLDRARQWAAEQSLAADDERRTDKHPAASRGRIVPTSDDTIAVDWSLAPPPAAPVSPALTPAKPLNSLPAAPPIPAPPDPTDRLFIGVTRGDHWNAAVRSCEMAVEEVYARCLYERCDVHETRKRVMAAIKSKHRAQMEPFPGPKMSQPPHPEDEA